MYRNILVAIDGGVASQIVIEHAVALAKALGARITGVHAVADFLPPLDSAFQSYAFPSREEYARLAKSEAEGVLAHVSRACSAAGVECSLAHGVDSRPYHLILATAVEHACDLICMGSHGRGSLGALFLGSQTQRVLAHGKLPVLVIRSD